ncbi:hypothetical protein RND81_14G134300 [Saponaria officinalis]|uniref:Uncharacterized protein n=1 Tax=Saponaria officinalis TaxID=3572 RepID=A0AAW1GM07_SAPOF
MGRAPCCDKVGLKRGPWTPEEDRILISFIVKHGHSNWRALPKQAGLLRCGKSCRLRWINYLKPDIKRGNFTKEEEDAIIQLHEMMGNRWSAIASRLPGRTDNEIKNVWHTHLKKRLNNKQYHTPNSHAKVTRKNCEVANNNNLTSNNSTNSYNLSETSSSTSKQVPNSSQQSYNTSDDFSSLTDVSSVNVPSKTSDTTGTHKFKECELDEHPIIDETFWSIEEFSYDDIGVNFDFSDIIEDEMIMKSSEKLLSNGTTIQWDNLDFWFDVFVSANWAPQLPEF